MSDQQFQAMVVHKIGENRFERRIEQRAIADLPAGDVLVQVHYSSLNYKDALSTIGNRGVTRRYPHTPGIDAAGVVHHSEDPRFAAGDAVIVTSYDLGMDTAGGFGQFIRVPADWVVRLPDGLGLKESMVMGTAGFTAGLSLWHLENAGVSPEQGEILVTGATGGVGSLAVAILATAGYRVVAVSGKPDAEPFLRRIGAVEIIDRDAARDKTGRPMLSGRWAGVIDTVGGEYLATAIKSTRPWGVVTCCGLVASPDLPTSVFPFILRGIQLIGIDSQDCPMPIRSKVWSKLAGPWKSKHLENLATEVGLTGLGEKIDLILKGGIKGRIVVRLRD